MDRLTRAQILEALSSAGVIPPATASISQLRTLYEATLPETSVNPQNSDNSAPLDPSEETDNADSDENLQLTLERLEKRKKILLLQKEIAALEQDNQASMRPARVDFSDIEHSIQKFSGSDSYGIRKWIADFEDVVTSFGCDERFKLLCARRLMTGTAKIFLRTITIQSWEQLKAALLEEFGRRKEDFEIYDKLRSRIKRPDESYQQYVLIMQEYAMNLDISEQVLIEFIILGLRDSSSNVALLYGAKNIADLKTLLVKYERLRSKAIMTPPTTRASATTASTRTSATSARTPITSASGRTSTSADGTLLTKTPLDQIRCFNCSKLGHFSSECPKEKRPIGSCFNCASLEHVYRNCPSRKQVGAATSDIQPPEPNDIEDDVDDIAQALSATQMVSVAISLGNCKYTQFLNCNSLLDTGSPASFIHQSKLPSDLQKGELKYSNLKGLGNTKLYTYGRIKCRLRLANREEEVHFLVIPDNVIPIPLLIGRDILKQFNVHLSAFCPKKFSIKKMNSIEINPEFNLPSSSYFLDVCAYKPSELRKIASSYAENNPLNIRTSNRLEHLTKTNIPGKLCEHFNKKLDLSDSLGQCEPFVGLGLNGNGIQIEPVVLAENNIFAIDIDNLQDELLIEPTLSLDKKRELECIVKQDYMNSSVTPKPPNYEMEIRLTSDTPFHHLPRRLSYKEKSEVRDIVRNLLDEGIVRPSNSPYASPIVLVKKKSGETRMCVDYRTLNKLTVRDNFPIPLIEDCLEYLANKKYFTILDLRSGFHHVKMADSSARFTSFVTPSGQYEYIRMPFGLKNAPSVFQRYISQIFRTFTDNNEIVVYFDDILIASENFEDHKKLLSRVLCCCAENGLQLKMSKCHFAYLELEYLGYSVSKEGIRPGESHVKAIKNYPVPKNVKQLQSYFGLCSYFRRFVPSFSRIGRPLQRLLSKNVRFVFDSECMSAFNQLREALISAPVLSIYDPTRETELHCDASSLGYGAVLLQKQDDNKFHPTAYFSKSTTSAESKYHSFELETLAIIYALRRFRVYLEGIPFKIVTDCSSLTLTLNKKTVNPRIARWALELENYNYTVQHRSGVNMNHVDALSRCYTVAVVDSEDIDFQLRATQSRDPIILELKQKLSNAEDKLYEMKDGIIFRKNPRNQLLMYVPSEMESNLIRHIHEKIGHLGVTKCYEQLKMHYWFPNMMNKVEKFIQNCIRCIMYSAPARTNQRNLYNIPKEPIPFHTLHLDHFGPLPSLQSKRKHILVVVDAFTKFVKLYPVVSTSTKEVCASLNKYFEYYSRPSRIITDRGSAFTSLEFSNYLLERNITHVKVAVASPQANGQVERVNRTLTGILSKLSESLQHSDWVKQLAQVEFALNNTVSRSIQTTPSKLLFGIDQKGIIVDRLTEFLEDKNVNQVQRNLDVIREHAYSSIKKSQDANLRQFDEHHIPAKTYEVGEYVVIKNTDTTIGKNKKLIPKFKGPYVVHKVLPNDRYVIRDIEDCPITQLPYDGVIEACNIRKWVKIPS